MFRRLKYLMLSLAIIVLLPVAGLIAATLTPCTLCVLELQTQGLHGEEDQDFVVITNRGTTNVTSVQLRYFNNAGVLSDSMTLSLGTLAAGATKAYVSSGLAAANPGVDSLKAMALSSAGGTVQLSKTASGVTTIFDTVGWGAATVVKESTPVPLHANGATIARKSIGGIVQDEGNNATDFEVVMQACQGVTFSEVQPFATDQTGAAVDAWVELLGQGNVQGSCWLVNANSEEYYIDAPTMPAADELVIVDGGVGIDGNVTPLHLGDGAGSLWLDGMSVYGGSRPVHLPLASLSFGAMLRGQSWALVDGIWRRTYQQTPGALNSFVADQTLSDDDPGACDDIRITEVLANPAGDDTDREWIEIHNQSSQITSLARCQINVGGETYSFLIDDALAPDEWRAVGVFFEPTGTMQTLNLKNTGETIISWQRTLADTATTLQTLSYTDAPEGLAWQRQAEGWLWAIPNPDADNLTVPSPSDTPQAEPAAPIESSPGDAGGLVPVVDSTGLQITELLPNPAAPQSDDHDEYIELFNGGTIAIDLAGYKLQTGDSYNYSLTLPQYVISPGSYYQLTSGDTSLSLANGSGRARIVDPNGELVYETDPYQSAPAGQAWSLVEGKWQWTTQPTAGAPNVLALPPAKTAASAAKASSKKTTKASATKAAKTAKTTAKKPSSKDAKAAATTSNSSTGSKDPAKLHLAVLAAIGVMAVLYAAYEYRQDIANKFYQLRRFRADRRVTRSSA